MFMKINFNSFFCCRYRKSFVALQSLSTETLKSDAPVLQQARSTSLDQVPTLNNYIVNICDVVVRSKAFVSKDVRAVVSLGPNDVQGPGVHIRKFAKAFALYRHPALMGQVVRFLKEVRNFITF